MAYQAGKIFQKNVSYQSVTLVSDPATGGTGPYTYQWYRDLWPEFTPGSGNLLPGLTSLMATDTGLTQNTIYFYKLQAIDTGNGNLPANSDPFGVLTAVNRTGAGPWVDPSVQQFKWFFTRDFPFGTDPNTGILDFDVLRAMQACNSTFRSDIWNNQGEYNQAYLYLTAHHLVSNMQASSQGVAAEYEFIHQSKSALGVSASSMIPTAIQDGPLQAALVKTPYGKRYWEMVRPRVVGTFYAVENRVSPL
ncbi:MAG TPA: DUF4054 domain-containing protein [Candidatus Sulfotelmatobacter sp.]|nr:DUF4054 domain-containing protein [Candidatus Sulfotelmatobacter sp.]